MSGDLSSLRPVGQNCRVKFVPVFVKVCVCVCVCVCEGVSVCVWRENRRAK